MKTKGTDSSYQIRRSDSTPIYRQIADQLRHRIISNDFADGKKLPSNRELANLYRVNHLTVRQALKLLEHEGIIDIAHGRGAFLMGASPFRLQTALVLPSLGQEQSGILSQAIRSELGGDATIHVLDYHNRASEEVACLERIRKEEYNSAIIYTSMQGDAVRTILQMLVDGFPLVMVDRQFEDVPGSYVISDNYRGGYLATKLMLDRGCKRIAAVTADIPSVRERLRGYREALAEAGIRFNQDLVVMLKSDGDVDGVATSRLLESGADPDGIFYYNDYQALIGAQQLKAAGKKIPSDIRIVGFDDLTMARFAEPALTTVRQNHEQVGREAARMLQELVKVPPNQRFVMKRSVVPVDLIVRESA